jgi:hypothetical protein
MYPYSQRETVFHLIYEYGYTKTLQTILNLWLDSKINHQRLEYFFYLIAASFKTEYNRKLKCTFKSLVSRETVGAL